MSFKAKQMNVKTLLRLGGILVSMAALIYVLRSIFSYSEQVTGAFFSTEYSTTVLVAAVFYAISLQLIGLSWYILLVSFGERSISLSLALQIFARTQLYKYLPTNVMHMLGRFIIAANHGASKSALSYAQVLEAVLMVLSAATVALVFNFSFFLTAADNIGISKTVTLSIYCLFFLFVFFLIYLIYIKNISQGDGVITFVLSILVFFSYASFFVANGLILVALLKTLTGTVADLRVIIGIAATGWIFGFIVPGAPGGFGVREAIFIAGLSNVGILPASATAVAIAHRLITLVGDVLLFGAELLYRKSGES